MTFLNKAFLIFIFMLLYFFSSFVLRRSKKIIKIIILSVEIISLLILLIFVKDLSIINIICNPIWVNLLLFISFLIISNIAICLVKNKFCSKIPNVLMIIGLLTNAFICFYDVNSEQTEKTLLNDMPFLTLQQLEKNDIIWDDVYVYTKIKCRKNIFINKSIVANELMPHLTHEESQKHSIRAIYTEYYDLSSKHTIPKLLLSRLMEGNTICNKNIYESNYFDECYYYHINLDDDKVFYIFYRIDNIVVHSQVFTEEDFEIDKIITAIENLEIHD